MMEKRNVYTVSRLNQEVRRLILDHFSLIYLQGEISDFARAASGHLYFSLKDQQSRVRCVMFRSQSLRLKCKPGNGLHAVISARVDFYTIRGEFQLIVQTLKPEKQGELQKQLEELKKKLLDEGLFAEERKKPLPAMPQNIGIITSLQGAALQDILSALRVRWRLAEAIIFPVMVQGDEAVKGLCDMIRLADSSYELDLLVVARGGGSLEDLMAFNAEALARAIAACQTPVITGIGHEIDFTIADLAADRRAPTPTAAITLATPDQGEVAENLSRIAEGLQKCIQQTLNREKQKLQLCNYRLTSLHPVLRLETMMQFCDEASRRLRQSMLLSLAGKRQWLRQAGKRLLSKQATEKIIRLRKELRLLNKNLSQAIAFLMQRQRSHFEGLRARHETLSPYATLERGYAIVSRQDGSVVDTVRKVKPGEALKVRVRDGLMDVSLKKINSDKIIINRLK